MHIAEGFLPVSHAVGWAAASAPFVIYGGYRISRQLKEQPDTGLLLAASGAFTFVLSALKIPSVTGSCSHPTGTGLGAVLFKPPVMAVLGTIVLLFQALLLAHGGITTLGANVFSMAIVGPWVGYAAWKAARGAGLNTSIAIFLAAVFSDVSTYLVAAFQLALAHANGAFGGAFVDFLMVYAPTQVPLAIVEGLVTVIIFRSLSQVASKEFFQLGVFGKAQPAGASQSGASQSGSAGAPGAAGQPHPSNKVGV